jgi:hypothetical protein
MIEMSKRGFRKREPVEATHLVERPSTLKSIIKAHLFDLEFSLDDLSEMFGLLVEDVEALYPVPPRKPMLRLVS